MVSSDEIPEPAQASPEVAGAEESFWADPKRRRHLEDLARQLSGDRPRWRVLERARALLRRLRGQDP